jgi:FAD:protein FMN transferase
MTKSEIEFTFSAMNTEVNVVVFEPRSGSLDELVRKLFAESEQRFSRFIESSELNVLNRIGELRSASGEMMSILESCKRHHESTGGLFNPAILSDLESAGYDRSFELMNFGAKGDESVSPESLRLNDVLVIDRDQKCVVSKSRLDLGGIAKGWTVDRASELMSTECTGWLIDAGGDIFCGGLSPDHDGWVVGIDDPFLDEEMADVVRLTDSAIATSSTIKRSWTINGERRHHIIDPNTHRSASSGLAAVSVVAKTAELADVLAKCSVILGESDSRELLFANDSTARFTREDGSSVETENWPSLLVDQSYFSPAKSRMMA